MNANCSEIQVTGGVEFGELLGSRIGTVFLVEGIVAVLVIPELDLTRDVRSENTYAGAHFCQQRAILAASLDLSLDTVPIVEAERLRHQDCSVKLASHGFALGTFGAAFIVAPHFFVRPMCGQNRDRIVNVCRSLCIASS